MKNTNEQGWEKEFDELLMQLGGVVIDFEGNLRNGGIKIIRNYIRDILISQKEQWKAEVVGEIEKFTPDLCENSTEFRNFVLSLLTNPNKNHD